MAKEEFYQQFNNFLAEQTKESLDSLKETDNLLHHGYIDSLSMVSLIIFLEDVTGKQIEIEKYDIHTFYTMKSIYETIINKD